MPPIGQKLIFLLVDHDGRVQHGVINSIDIQTIMDCLEQHPFLIIWMIMHMEEVVDGLEGGGIDIYICFKKNLIHTSLASAMIQLSSLSMAYVFAWLFVFTWILSKV